MVPVAGDTHQHALSPVHVRALAAVPPLSPGYCTGDVGIRHEFGFPPVVLDEMRSHGYDWGSVSPHVSSFDQETEVAGLAYEWWIGTAQPIFPGDPTAILDVFPIPGSNPPTLYTFHRSAQGYPLYQADDPTFQNVGAVNPPFSAWLSNGSAADSRNVPGSFVALAGAEYTTFSWVGHTIVVLPSAVRGCTVATNGSVSPSNCDSFWELSRWLVQKGGVSIFAHPGGFVFPPLNPVSQPMGHTDSSEVGVEVGEGYSGLNGPVDGPRWEGSFRAAAVQGQRVFPAYGGDRHQAAYPYCVSQPAESPDIKYGATVCWVSSFDRTGVFDAMRARRCYFSDSHKPLLKFEVCNSATCAGGVAKMGDKLLPSFGAIYVRASATNDVRNQDAAIDKRLDRLEVVHQDGTVIFARSCSRGTNGSGPGAVPDSCLVSNFTQVVLPAPQQKGAVYARACELAPPATACSEGSTQTVLVSAPVYLNWASYKATTGWRYCDFDAATVPCGTPGCLDPTVDSDGDGFPNTCDACPTFADPNQYDNDHDGYGNTCDATCGGSDSVAAPDSDGDGFPDLCDNCVFANPNQRDKDSDGIGDMCDPDCGGSMQAVAPDSDGDGYANLCDNCPSTFNDQLDHDGDGVGTACDNCPGTQPGTFIKSANSNQADADADGVGDKCDNCVNVANPRVDPSFLASNPWATLSGTQRDDDWDGYGNKCDAKFTGTQGAPVDATDHAEFSASMNKNRGLDICGTGGTRPCAMFDLDELNTLIGASDLSRFNALNGSPPGPKCSGCPYPCQSGSAGLCPAPP